MNDLTGNTRPATPDPADSGTNAPVEQTPQIEGYQTIGKISEGGMGSVWRAIDLDTQREVTIKVIHPRVLSSEQARLRFEREVRLAASLNHPNIACVYDASLRGVFYYAMPYVRGVSMDKFVKGHRLTTRQILQLVRTVCETVSYAHNRGIVHRDLKPSNILITEDGQPHVLDFGLAKSFLQGGDESNLTMSGYAFGTYAFMSPEQKEGLHDQVDFRSDVYSLGVVLFCLLTGESPHALSGFHFNPVRALGGEASLFFPETWQGMDDRLWEVLSRALAFDRKLRYRDAGEFAAAIDEYLSVGPPAQVRQESPTPSVSPFADHLPAPSNLPPLVPRFNPQTRVPKLDYRVIAVTVTVGLALLIWLFPRLFREPAPSSRQDGEATKMQQQAANTPSKPETGSPDHNGQVNPPQEQPLPLSQQTGSPSPIENVPAIAPEPQTTPAPTGVETYMQMAAIHMANKSYTEAVDDLSKVIELDSKSELGYLNRGLALFRQGKVDEAIADFRKAREIDPANPAAQSFYEQALELKSASESPRPVAPTERASPPASRPDLSGARAAYARGLKAIEQDSNAEAITELTEAIRLDPSMTDAYLNRGRLLLQLGDQVKALRDFSAAVQISPKSSAVHFYRGQAYLRTKDYKSAVADFNEAIRLDASQVNLYNFRAQTQIKLREYEKAIADTSRMIEMEPASPLGYGFRGQAQLARGRADLAIRDLAEAILREPRDADWYYYRSQAYEKLGRLEESKADLARARQLNPSVGRE